jgi:ClpP class serine protease
LARSARGASFSFRAERPTAARRVSLTRALAAEGEESDNGPASSQRSPALMGPRVAVIEVRGPLSSEAFEFECGFSDGYIGDGGIVGQVSEALADANVVAAVLDIMSPGGDAQGLGEAAAQLAALREGSSKPMLVYARQALSAAYWLACAAAGDGGLYVSESSDVGNVGCWTQHVDYSAANAQEGIKVTYVADPPGKVLGNPDEPLADEALARMQRNVAEVTTRFAAAVASYRPALTSEAVMALNGDTRRGSAAVADGLADGLAGSLEDVVALALARAQPTPAAPTTPASPTPPVDTGALRFAATKGSHASMRFSPSLLAAAGLSAEASSAAVEAALLPRLALANAALASLKESDPTRALGMLAARLELAEGAESLRAQLAAKEAESDSARREKMVETAVSRGKLRSGQAFRWRAGPVDASGAETRVRELAPFLATMPTAALEGYLDGLPALHRDASAQLIEDMSAADAADAGRGVDPRTRRLAALAKIDPVRLDKATRAAFSLRAGSEES